MIRIIQKGNDPVARFYRTTCNHCHTIFEFQAVDAIHFTDARDGDAWKLACPVCTWTCFVSTDVKGYDDESAGREDAASA